MQAYTIYRHPQQGDVAVPRSGLLSGWRSTRLLRAGYRDAGLIEAPSAREALARAHGLKPATMTAAARTPTRATNAPHRPGAGPAPGTPSTAMIVRIGSGFVWFAVGLFFIVQILNREPAPDYDQFSDWMDYAEIERHMQQLEGQPIWVTEVEGRWRRGEPECRVRIARAPERVQYRWVWWCVRPREEFAQIDRDLRNEGYERVSLHTVADDKSRIHHSGAWHRIKPSQ